MDPIKLADTEKETPTTPGQGEEGNKPTDDVVPKATYDEVVKKLEEKTTQATQLTDELRKAREANKPLLQPIEPKMEQPVKVDPEPFEVDEFDTKYEQRRSQEKKQEYVTRANRCFNKFIGQDGIELDFETDIRFREIANRTILGETDEEVMETFQVIYNGLVKSSLKKEEKPEHITVGDGGSEEPKKPGKSVWLTKRLNKDEQAAANVFPGGEQAYRKKMQERAEKGLS